MMDDTWQLALQAAEGPVWMIGDSAHFPATSQSRLHLQHLEEVLERPAEQQAELVLVATALRGDALREDQALARLRDLLAQRILLITRDEDELATRLLSLGYRILGRNSGQLAAGFDLHDYKQCPEWLNARHWANPENWGRFRW